jgi:hypothetical protein
LALIVALTLACEASDPAGSDPPVALDAGDLDSGRMRDAGAADATSDPDAAGGGEGGTSGSGGQGGEAGRDGGGDGDGDGDGDPEPDAATADAALPTDAAQNSAQGAACLGAGSQVTPSGEGACASPFIIDMRALDHGDGVFHSAGAESTNGLVPSIGKCASGTARDIVYTVQLPSEADLEVSVDAAPGADPSILVQAGPDATCEAAAALECIDEGGAGDCEYLRVRAAQGGFEGATPQVVVGEVEHSGVPLTVRFRLIDPAGGS